MKIIKRRDLSFALLVLLCLGCKEPFEPEISSFDHSILVVEGYIEVGGGETSISLGRTRPVYDSMSLAPLHWAMVNVEGENGTFWQLNHQGDGSYTLTDYLPENQNYRLRIETDGQEYLSDWITPILSPEIDEITFERKDGDVTVYANTLGSENARYFLWQFEETWVYRSYYRTSYKYEPNTKEVVPLPEEEWTNKCWQTDISKRIILASSERYQNNYIYQKELLTVDSLSEKLGERYSVLVRQKAIDQEAFVFWEAIRKNSDDIGGIFSPLPSLISSNLVNVNDPEEPVIGYVSAGKSAEKRIYIDRKEVDPWRTLIADYNNCQIDTVLSRDYQAFFGGGYYIPLSVYCEGSSCPGFLATTRDCADCSVRGGFLEQPEFWGD